jgi:hypothetical protein
MSSRISKCGASAVAAGQIESDDVARRVRFGVDFGGETAARATERLRFPSASIQSVECPA